MKGFYVIFCVCFAVFITIESKGTVKKYTEKLSNGHVIQNANANDACTNASEITVDFLQKLNMTDEELEAPEHQETKFKIGCYITCLMQEKEIMNGSEINTEKIVDLLKSSADSSEELTQDTINIIGNVVRDCGKQVENMTNACDVGWKFGKCIGEIVTF